MPTLRDTRRKEATTDYERKQPVLPGEGASDYERYLRTDALLALQKRPEEMVHRDELLFQTVHQSSELWLKLAASEVEEAIVLVEAGELAEAARLLERPALSLRLITEQLEMLERMDPWEYQTIRKALGHGSGFDSPGFHSVRRLAPGLGVAFRARLGAAGVSVPELYRRRLELRELYDLAERLIELDKWITSWRMRHYKVITRVIGEAAMGTQGTPVEVVGSLIRQKLYPELWEARDELVALANAET